MFADYPAKIFNMRRETGNCKKRVVVLGAGISGLWAAHSLLSINPSLDVTVLEKNDAPGGLFNSSDRCGFHFNHGLFLFPADSPLIAMQPHRFHPVTVSYDKVLGGRLIRFPVDPSEMRAISRPSQIPGFVSHMIRRHVRRQKDMRPGDLNAWLRLHLPDAWSRTFRIDDYVYKLMGHEPADLSQDVGSQRLEYIVRMLRPEHLSRHLSRRLKMMMGPTPKTPPPSEVSHYTLNAEGTGGFIRELARKCEALGARIQTGVDIRRISRLVSGFQVEFDGVEPLPCDVVVSTIPLTEFARYRNGSATAVDKLKWRNIALFFFRLKRTLPGQPIRVIYSFDRSQIWKRVVMRRMDDTHAAVRVEMCSDGPMKHRRDALRQTIQRDLSNIFNVQHDDDWTDWEAMDVPYGYPCLLKGYEKQVADLRQAILEPGLYTLSRQGIHRYSTSSICARLVESGVADIAEHHHLHRAI